MFFMNLLYLLAYCIKISNIIRYESEGLLHFCFYLDLNKMKCSHKCELLFYECQNSDANSSLTNIYSIVLPTRVSFWNLRG